MQNYIKSQTRLAFVQYIFQSEFLNLNSNDSIDEFLKYFFNTNIATIDDKKDIKLKFNKTFLKKLSVNYLQNFNKNNIIKNINNYVELDRKFEKWNSVLKSIIFALISELEMTDEKKIKIVFNDYINISKSLVLSKETKLMNAVIEKYLNEKKILKK